jgi:hypothetical protein
MYNCFCNPNKARLELERTNFCIYKFLGPAGNFFRYCNYNFIIILLGLPKINSRVWKRYN